ncbi:MAG: hypothetical protein IKR19_07760 [Acholeplasmatales bacterium]|nr:hypothetical protein [Acholeplasmatales bacterium]
MILKGTIYITDNPEVIYNTPLNVTKIISLDEDGILQDKNNTFIGGTCLLPPMEAKIAEVDNNEVLYDQFYQSHLLDPYQQQFIAALISYLYKGGNLVLFLPEIGYTNTRDKLIQHMWLLYGIHIGIIGAEDPMQANCYYDEKCVVMWLNMIYTSKVISAKEYLFMLPEDALLNNMTVISELIDELHPLGDSINDKINTLNHYRKSIKINPNANLALILL